MLRLVVGETWDDATRLRGLALKRIYTYKTKEQTTRRARSVVQRAPSGNENKLTRALSKKLSNNGAVTVGTWEDTLEELGKAPAAKLFPLVKVRLCVVFAAAGFDQLLIDYMHSCCWWTWVQSPLPTRV